MTVTLTPRDRVRPTVARLCPNSSRPRNLEEPKRTTAVCAVSPAACGVSAQSGRRAWTCLAATCVGEGAPVASSQVSPAHVFCVPIPAKSLAACLCTIMILAELGICTALLKKDSRGRVAVRPSAQPAGHGDAPVMRRSDTSTRINAFDPVPAEVHLR